MLEGQYADTGWPAKEKPPCARRQAEPTGCNHANDVGAGECQNVPIDAACPGDKAVGAGGDFAGRFAAGTAVAEHFPAGPLLHNLPGQLALEVAVVPLHQVGIDLRNVPETGQGACLGGTLQGAGENVSKGKSPQPLAEPTGALFSALVQRQIRSARSLA